ncbi:MAG: hypothetical protein KBB86_00170 [Candidatus Pacebacteria bacterium]|nr:hypothetical protein [Candidatus Paceibacterota bacterium]
MESFNPNESDNNLDNYLDKKLNSEKSPEHEPEVLFKDKNFLGKTREIISSIGEAFGDMPVLMKATLISTVAFFTALPVVEQGKRMYADNEYDKAKEMLHEYVINNTPETPTPFQVDQEKYDKAVEMFGQDNLWWLEEAETDNTDKENFDYDTASINRGIKHYETKRGVFDYVFKSSYSIPRFFSENHYLQDAKDIQDRINKLPKYSENQTGKSLDSTTISYDSDAVVGFRDRENKNKFDTLRKETFKKIIYETYPKNWFNGDISSIVMHNTGDPDTSYNYGSPVVAAAQMSRNNQKMEFFDYMNEFENNPEWMFSVLSHESAHANDWGAIEGLNKNERLDFLTSLSERIYAPDRFISSYVEDKIVNENLKDRLYNRSVEYWAEICGEYFANGKGNLSPKDVKIIDKIIKIKDTDFSIDEALSRRFEIIHKDIYKVGPEKMKLLDDFKAIIKLQKLSNDFSQKFYDFIKKNKNVDNGINYIFNEKSKRYELIEGNSDTVLAQECIDAINANHELFKNKKIEYVFDPISKQFNRTGDSLSLAKFKQYETFMTEHEDVIRDLQYYIDEITDTYVLKGPTINMALAKEYLRLRNAEQESWQRIVNKVKKFNIKNKGSSELKPYRGYGMYSKY